MKNLFLLSLACVGSFLLYSFGLPDHIEKPLIERGVTPHLEEASVYAMSRDSTDTTLFFEDILIKIDADGIGRYTIADLRESRPDLFIYQLSFSESLTSDIEVSNDQLMAGCSEIGTHQVHIIAQDLRQPIHQAVLIEREVTVTVREGITPVFDNLSFALDSDNSLSISVDDVLQGIDLGCSDPASSITDISLNRTDFSCADLNQFTGSLYFDGDLSISVLSFGSVLQNLTLTDNFTIEAWVKPDNSTGLGRIISKPVDNLQNYGLYLNEGVPTVTVNYEQSNGVLRTTNVAGPESINDDQWHHLAGVLETRANSRWLTLYVDGKHVGERQVDGVPVTKNRFLFIGAFSPDAQFQNQNFEGEISDVRIWNIARTESQISDGRMSGISENDEGLVLYYDFFEEVGSSNFIRNRVPGIFEALYGALRNVNASNMWGFRNIGVVPALLNISHVAGFTETFSIDFQIEGSEINQQPIASRFHNLNVSLDENGNGTLNEPELLAGLSIDCREESEFDINLSRTSFSCADINQSTGSLYFDGIDDQVFVEDNNTLAMSSSFTIEAWVKPDSATGLGRVISKPAGSRQNYGLYLNNGIPTVTINFASNGGTVNVSASESIDDQLWHHLGAVFNDASNTLSLYVDGQKVAEHAANRTPINSNSGLFIGTFSNDARFLNQRFRGEISEVRIWNVARSEADIVQYWQTGTDSGMDGLLAYFDFIEGSGIQVLTSQIDRSFFGRLENIDVSTSWRRRNVGVVPATLSVSSLLGTVNPQLIEGNVTVQGRVSYDSTFTVADTVDLYLNQSGEAILLVNDVVTFNNDCFEGQFILQPSTFDCENLFRPNSSVLILFSDSGDPFAQEIVVNLRDTIAPIVITDDLVLQLAEGDTVTIVPEELIFSVEKACFFNELDSLGDLASLSKNTFTSADAGENEVRVEVAYPTEFGDFNGFATATVTVIVNGNTNSRTESSNLTTTIASAKAENIFNVQLYPNPVSDELTITKNGGDGLVRISMMSVNGSAVIKELVLAEESIKIDLSEVKNGLYLLKISDGINECFKKLIVKH